MKKTGKVKIYRAVRYLMAVICIMICGIMVQKPEKAEAASSGGRFEYRNVFEDTTREGEVVRCGGYYFKYYNRTWPVCDVYISTRSNSGYRKIPNCRTNKIGFNGASVYFANNTYVSGYTNGYQNMAHVLYKYTPNINKTYRMKVLPGKVDSCTGDFRYNVSYVYGCRVFLTISDEWPDATYVYNAATKKIAKMISKSGTSGTIELTHGKYFVTKDNYHSDVTPSSFSIWKITSKGAVRITTLTKYGFSGRFFFHGNALYYARSTNSSGKDLILCKYDLNTHAKKRLATFRTNEAYRIGVDDVTSTYFKYSKYNYSDGMFYRYKYVYSTKRSILYSRGE